jgi:squalene cyclase
MSNWIRQLRFNPIHVLAECENEAISYFARRDLLDQPAEPVYALWKLPEVTKLLAKQKIDGSWKYHGGKETIRSQENYDQLETYKTLGILVEKYGFTSEHPAIQEAADFLFSFQTEEGDFRGIYGNQYTPNYSAGIMELLIKAGYGNDEQIERGFKWLLGMRQNDGGWAVPTRTLRGEDAITLMQAMRKREPIQPDRSKPFSHLVTGIVLRAFAAHPTYQNMTEAKRAGELLKTRFFKSDTYPDRKDSSFWTKFTYPFWFTDLLSSLDSLSTLGFSSEDLQVKEALQWFINGQQEDGLWKVKLLKSGGDKNLRLWVSLAICRVFKRVYKAL